MLAERPWDHPDAVLLRNELFDEVAVVYGRDDSEPAGSEATGADVVLIAYRDDQPVATGALRVIEPHVGELKRMYAAPSARGTGAATEILRGLEAWARDHGLTTVRLETGDLLHAAQRFYVREGYAPIPLYGHYIGSDLSRCFEKNL